MKQQEEAPTIQSKRLAMRSLSSADEAFYCSLYMDAEVMRYVGEPLDKEAASEAFRITLERMKQESFERRVLVLTDRSTQTPIGISSVRLLRNSPGRAEVGTLLKPGMQEKGFALECSTALISQAFTRPQIDELVAHSAVGNAAIEGLLKELGFSPGETLPEDKLRPARTVWTLTRDAWEKRMAAVRTAPPKEKPKKKKTPPAKAKAKPRPKPRPKPKSKAKAKSKSRAKAAAKARTKAKPKSQAKVKSRAKSKAKSKVKTKARSRVKARSKAGSKRRSKSKAK